MKIFNKILTGAAALLAGLTVSLAAGGVSQAAAGCYTYNPNGDSITSHTPVFNNFCDAPFGVGDESDFVRVRQSTNGNDMDNQGNPKYTNTLSTACDANTKYDVWNYVHNNASPGDNANGSGTAVAHDVKLALSAPLGKTAASFQFGATVSASNATSVSDTAVINCNAGKQVKLSIIPSTVHVYSAQYGWKDLGDGSVNSTFKIGSPTLGSGDQWGCWDYRVIVVYQVTVTELPVVQPEVTATCDLFSLNPTDENGIRKVTVKDFKFSVKNTTLVSETVNWGDDSTPVVLTETDGPAATKAVEALTHTYAQDGQHKATLSLIFANDKNKSVTSDNCSPSVTFTSSTPPTTTPPVITTPKPKQLVDTGAGSVVGIFAAVSMVGAVAHRYFLGRKLTQN